MNVANPVSKKQPIMIRVMDAGSGGRDASYFRVSVGNKGALTLDGTLSNDMANTHINLTDNYEQLIDQMISGYISKYSK